MTRGRFFRQYHFFSAPICGPVFLSVLVGSLFGAFCASLQIRGLQPLQTVLREGSAAFPQILLRCLRFPALLTAALLLRRRSLIYLLFFLKGATISFVLCVLSGSVDPRPLSLLLRIFFESVVPLPALLILGSAWSCETENPRPDLRPLFPALILACFGILLEILFMK